MNNLTTIRGANYVPSYACNDTVLWECFDETIIDRELRYAEKLNLNSVRVFLQYIVYEENPTLFLEHFDRFLQLCSKHNLTLMPVLFDSCGSEPISGYQEVYERAKKEYTPTWQSSPGPSKEYIDNWDNLDRYIYDVVAPHKNDSRVILWDCFNEPRQSIVTHALVYHTIKKVRSIGVNQPVSACYGVGNAIGDVILLHPYVKNMKSLRRTVAAARSIRPDVLITEMAGRPNHGAFSDLIPTCQELNIGWYFWELIIGSTQFRYQWGNKVIPDHEDTIFQGILYPDGSAYNTDEIRWIDGSWKKTK